MSANVINCNILKKIYWNRVIFELFYSDLIRNTLDQNENNKNLLRTIIQTRITDDSNYFCN